YVGNIRVLKRMLSLMDVDHTVLADNSDIFDSPNDGDFKMYQGGTTLEDAADSINAQATLSLQKYSTTKTLPWIKQEWGQQTATYRPFGIRGTDEFLMAISELTGKAIPWELERERGRAVDAMTDSQAWVHGKRVALYGDPDFVMGLLNFVLEMGMEPVHVLVHNGNKKFKKEAEELLASTPLGKDATVWIGKDLWHMRSLLFTEPVDLIIGNSYAKYLERDTGIPLVRIGYPIFDRHHLHRYATLGYEGTLNLLNWIVNRVLEHADNTTNIPSETDISFDLVR
ncbi:MAG: nitrogenase molybdenum-iron protein subunit beta, partial [Merismopedia sp. SIO2A8]|nr:nitrogenase molybdenum-iron protein subunit beta [Merismopedia sp. SIO2A8]